MKEISIRMPSPAMVVAVVALFFAIGGSAWAVKKIGTAQIKNGAVTSSKLRTAAVTGAKLRDGAVTSSKVAAGVTGPIAYALVKADASLDSSASRGIESGDFSQPATGIFCMTNAPNEARTAMVALSGRSFSADDLDAVVSVGFAIDSVVPNPSWDGCEPGDDVRVTVNVPGTGTVNRGFYIWFDR